MVSKLVLRARIFDLSVDHSYMVRKGPFWVKTMVFCRAHHTFHTPHVAHSNAPACARALSSCYSRLAQHTASAGHWALCPHALWPQQVEQVANTCQSAKKSRSSCQLGRAYAGAPSRHYVFCLHPRRTLWARCAILICPSTNKQTWMSRLSSSLL